MKKGFTSCGLTLGFFASFVYIVCILGGYFIPRSAELMTLHNELLAITFPGFVWLGAGSFFYGLVLSFVYGWIVAILFHLACRLAGACKDGEHGSCCR